MVDIQMVISIEITTLEGGQKRSSLSVDNLVTVSGGKACDMSSFRMVYRKRAELA